MCNIENEKWLEAAQENFVDALNMDDIKLAKAIIADTFDAGFSEEARNFNEKLREYTKGISESKSL